jgi:hypothetical protein
MNAEWKCTQCETLLGMRLADHIHLKFKQAQYLVRGDAFTVVAVCRNCHTVCELGSKERPSPTIAA